MLPPRALRVPFVLTCWFAALAATAQAIPVSPDQAAALERLIQGPDLDPPSPCDSLEDPDLAPALVTWETRVRRLPPAPNLMGVIRENARYRQAFQSVYQWRDDMCFTDRRTHCLSVERDVSRVRGGRELVAGAEDGPQPPPTRSAQTRNCQSFDDGRYLICQEQDLYIGNSCWGTETTTAWERLGDGLSPP